MCARSGQEQQKLVLVYTINEQPIRLDMALSESRIVPGEFVISVLFRQRLLPNEQFYDIIQKIKLISALRSLLQVLPDRLERTTSSILKHLAHCVSE